MQEMGYRGEVKAAPVAAPSTNPIPMPSAPPPTKSNVKQARAIANYHDEGDATKLQLRIGEVVIIVDDHQSGWTQVMNQMGGFGWVPKSYLQEIRSEYM